MHNSSDGDDGVSATGNFQAMRESARRGQLRGTPVPSDGRFAGPTTSSSVKSNVVEVAKVVMRQSVKISKDKYEPPA